MTVSALHERSASHPIDEALAPVAEALLSAAQQDAARTLAAAEHRADEVVRKARTDAERTRADARAEGERDAQAVRRDQSARARRRARGIVLAAQSAALGQLRREVHQRLRQAWADPGHHDELRAALIDVAHEELGEDCEIREHPDGGVVATAGRGRVTYLLGDLADDVIDGLGHELDRLWAT
jgi:vacuolar-type H+-ATPase subunit E/Vma4